MKLTAKQVMALSLEAPRKPRGAAKSKHAQELARDIFRAQCEAWGLPSPEHEYPVCPRRKWRFDWAWPTKDVALEIQGGLFSGGRHVRPAWLLKEYEKLNEAAIRGWLVLLVTPKQVKNGEAFALVKRALEA